MQRIFGLLLCLLLSYSAAYAHDLAKPIARAMPAVVYIQVDNYVVRESVNPSTKELSLVRIPNRPIIGTGFIIDGNNVVTNHHVISFAIDNNTDIKVSFKGNKQKYKAKILGYDKVADIALLEIEGDHPSVKICGCDDAHAGDTVFSISHFYGIGWSATQGTVSSNERKDVRYPYINNLQLQLLQGSGSSGGPVFNTDGEVIALNRSIVSMFPRSITSVARSQSMLSMVGYPIRGDTLAKSIASIREELIVVYVDLGVSLTEFGEDSVFHINYSAGLPDYPYGTMVMSVDDPKKSLLKEADIIMDIDGKAFNHPVDLLLWLQNYDAGDIVNIQVYRNGEIINIAVELTLAGL